MKKDKINLILIAVGGSASRYLRELKEPDDMWTELEIFKALKEAYDKVLTDLTGD